MERRERHVLFQRGQDARVDADRRGVFQTAVNDAMAHANETIAGELPLEIAD